MDIYMCSIEVTLYPYNNESDVSIINVITNSLIVEHTIDTCIRMLAMIEYR